MPRELPLETLNLLQRYDQTHLLRFWHNLSDADQARLLSDISEVDFEQLRHLVGAAIDPGKDRAPAADPDSTVAETANSLGQLAPPQSLVRLPRSEADLNEWQEARRLGEQLLSEGRVGAILVAGGQGTRLGSADPKGMFPIGPATDRSLFQIFAETILALSRRWGKPISYYIMTSDATDRATREFFAKHDNFGLNAEDVHFFRQGRMPAVDCQTGKILLESAGALAMSPDGHGGMLAALAKAGLLDDMRQRGIEVLYYHQVDNPLAILCDPAFLGWHVRTASEMSTKVVRKVSAEEKMGVLVDRDGQTGIVEYSDIPPALAAETESDGSLRFWAGNTAIHAFNVSFLQRLVEDSTKHGGLLFHPARKKVPFVNESGVRVDPAAPNAWKFEKFIFDALPLTKKSLVLEADRGREFHPVKNAEGADSPATTRAALIRIYTDWMKEAGLPVAAGSPIELSPLIALDAEDLRLPKPANSKTSRFQVQP